MTNALRRAAAIFAAIAFGLVLLTAGTASAAPTWDDKHKRCAFGEAIGDAATTTPVPGSGIPANRATFNVCRTGPANSDVTGYFQAVVASTGLPQVQGPVTCAAFRGNEVSFLYPFNEKSVPPDPAGLNAILIVATDGGPNPADDKFGFFLAPTATFGNNCDFSTAQAQFARNVSALPLQSGKIEIKTKH